MQTELLEGLTDPQREAVQCTEGPLLVLAAAGSGKTRVITRRIAYLMSLGVPAWQILALTFTNKAAGEMRERVLAILEADEGDPRRTRGLTVTTFHSLCARLLRRYADRAGLPGLKPDYTIYDTADQTAAMKRALERLDLSTSNWPPRSVLGAISNAKNELLDSDAFAARAGDFYSKQLAKIYGAYQETLRRAGAIDFDDLLLLTARMLASDAGIRSECQDRWRYILIDEYQDTNQAQFQIASLLAGEGRAADSDLAGLPDVDEDDLGAVGGPNICVVGDPDQAIYGWRGADITNILEFEGHYPGARVITLGENFRSTRPILAIADTLIKHNTRRKDKPLFTSREGGEPIEAILCRDERHEAELIADWFRAQHDEHSVAWREMAVFYRTNALSRVMEDSLRQGGIPYTIARGTAFYQREEIKNAVAYLRVVANTADDVSLERIVNTPTRGIGKTSLDRVRMASQQAGVPLFGMMRRADELDGLTARSTGAMGKFVEILDGWTGAGSFMGSEVAGSLHELVERVIDESGLRAHYAKQARTSGAESDAERLDNLDELISSARQFGDEYDPAADPVTFPGADVLESGAETQVPPLLALLRAYLESIALVADADMVDPAQGAVTLMTLHAAKGLEFAAVAMIGLEEGLLPHSRAFDSDAALEEERRLAFVGITRAMQRLHITAARYRTIRGISERTIPSRFLEEIGSEHVTRSDQSDAWDAEPTHDASPMASGSMEAKLSAIRAVRRASSGPPASALFPPGSRVSHPQFGEGRVIEVNGAGSNARIQVNFKGLGKKTLVLEYARLKALE
ncbi:MAG: UvrD-helicase domain-containing protein [Phycisphaeraceae bacterium]|nr:MAG: UvrD-helicase domain-containing protein [Phycisphaeraceae bacterium]